MSSRYFRELNLGDTVLNIVNITNCCCEVRVLKTVALEVSVTPKWNCFKQGSANLFYKGTCGKYFRLCVTNVVQSLSWVWLCDPMNCNLPAQASRLLCPWAFPGKNTREGCHFLLQGIFLTQGSNLCVLPYGQILYFWVPREAQSFVWHTASVKTIRFWLSVKLTVDNFQTNEHNCIPIKLYKNGWQPQFGPVWVAVCKPLF